MHKLNVNNELQERNKVLINEVFKTMNYVPLSLSLSLSLSLYIYILMRSILNQVINFEAIKKIC